MQRYLFIFSFILLAIFTGFKPVQAASERPKIRVMLYDTNQPITITLSGNGKVFTEFGTIVSVAKDTIVTISYQPGANTYQAVVNGQTYTSPYALGVKTNKPNKLATITSYSNSPAWDTGLNDNEFYGSIELKAGMAGKVYVVNELGIENYVKGIAEASNGNPQAYLKTLYTAARTYAYYHYTHPTKHAGEPYLLDSTANDQVYRGYGLTKRSPNIVTAVDETAGMIVTYEGSVAITPYFSQSDGRTRSYNEVWGGDYAYLQSVDDPCCTEDTMLGHGVGLSAKGARYFAGQYWHWREILKYYYQGVELEAKW